MLEYVAGMQCKAQQAICMHNSTSQHTSHFEQLTKSINLGYFGTAAIWNIKYLPYAYCSTPSDVQPDKLLPIVITLFTGLLPSALQKTLVPQVPCQGTIFHHFDHFKLGIGSENNKHTFYAGKSKTSS